MLWIRVIFCFSTKNCNDFFIAISAFCSMTGFISKRMVEKPAVAVHHAAKHLDAQLWCHGDAEQLTVGIRAPHPIRDARDPQEDCVLDRVCFFALLLGAWWARTPEAGGTVRHTAP